MYICVYAQACLYISLFRFVRIPHNQNTCCQFQILFSKVISVQLTVGISQQSVEEISFCSHLEENTKALEAFWKIFYREKEDTTGIVLFS